jgi:hypothetical protein
VYLSKWLLKGFVAHLATPTLALHLDAHALSLVAVM